jgi:hypothetical protein
MVYYSANQVNQNRGIVSPSRAAPRNNVDSKTFLKTLFERMGDITLRLANPDSHEINLTEFGYGKVEKTSPAATLAISQIFDEMMNCSNLVMSIKQKMLSFQDEVAKAIGS